MIWDKGSQEKPLTVVTLDFPDADTAEFIGRLGCDGIAVDLEHSSPTAGNSPASPAPVRWPAFL